MSGALWVKITTGIWSSDPIKLIRKMPDGDTLLVIWFQMITQAGKCNAGGRLQMTDYIPLDAEMLAALFDRPLDVMERALGVFKRFEMIEYENDFACLPNWYKYQSKDGLEKVKEQNKNRQQKFRDKRKDDKKSNVTVTLPSNAKVTEKVTHKELELELELKDLKPLSIDQQTDPIPYAEIVGYLNELCGTNFKSTSEETKRLIRTRWSKGFRLEDFKRVIDNKNATWNKEPTKFEPKDMRPYLRPKTLFGTNFESYLNEKPPRGGGPIGGGSCDGQQGNKASKDYSAFIDE